MKLANREFKEIVITDGKNRVLAAITEENGNIQVVSYKDTMVFIENESHFFKNIPGGMVKYSPNSKKVISCMKQQEYINYIHNHGGNKPTKTFGWRPSCECSGKLIKHKHAKYEYIPNGPQPNPIPCTVIDPFSGAGTTGLVALRLERYYIGIELNPKDIELSKERIKKDNASYQYSLFEPLRTS